MSCHVTNTGKKLLRNTLNHYLILSCESCKSFFYDEEIMACWSFNDSDLQIKCPFCLTSLVPKLFIKAKVILFYFVASLQVYWVISKTWSKSIYFLILMIPDERSFLDKVLLVRIDSLFYRSLSLLMSINHQLKTGFKNLIFHPLNFREKLSLS